MICPNCAVPSEGNSKFCVSCGYPLSEEPSAPSLQPGANGSAPADSGGEVRARLNTPGSRLRLLAAGIVWWTAFGGAISGAIAVVLYGISYLYTGDGLDLNPLRVNWRDVDWSGVHWIFAAVCLMVAYFPFRRGSLSIAEWKAMRRRPDGIAWDGVRAEVLWAVQRIRAERQVKKQSAELRNLTLPPPSDLDVLFSFQGRIRRRTFWMVMLALLVLQIGRLLLQMSIMEGGGSPVGLLVLVGIPSAWVALSIYVKRFHDANLSGWLTLALFIPLLGIAVAIVCGILPGTAGPNRYGMDPRLGSLPTSEVGKGNQAAAGEGVRGE